jgi:hypothetical protein
VDIKQEQSVLGPTQLETFGIMNVQDRQTVGERSRGVRIRLAPRTGGMTGSESSAQQGGKEQCTICHILIFFVKDTVIYLI